MIILIIFALRKLTDYLILAVYLSTRFCKECKLWIKDKSVPISQNCKYSTKIYVLYHNVSKMFLILNISKIVTSSKCKI